MMTEDIQDSITSLRNEVELLGERLVEVQNQVISLILLRDKLLTNRVTKLLEV